MFRQASLRINPKLFLWNSTCSFSSEPLKQDLMRNLKDIRSCNNAQKLCGVLINAKNTIEGPKSVATSTRNSFINQISKILNENKPEYTQVDMICKVLSERDIFTDEISTNEIDKRNKLMSLLLDVKKLSTTSSSYDSSIDYLREIINGVESIIGSSDKNSSYSNECKRNQPGGFGLLQSVLRESAADQAGYLLQTIYKIGRAHLNFSEEEKKEIGTLMVETIEPVSQCIKSINWSDRLHSSWLINRSSLQFYKDFYAKFPTENGTLLESFNMEEIHDSIPRLDQLIIDWCVEASGRIANNLNGIENIDYDTDPDETDLDEDNLPEMPKSHTWWTICVLLMKELKKAKPYQLCFIYMKGCK